jgi:hypothetical protein
VVTYLTVDGYFAKQKYTDEVGALTRHLITKLRGDADCKFLYTVPHPKRKGARRKYDGRANGKTCAGSTLWGHWPRPIRCICIWRWSGTSPSGGACAGWCWSIGKTRPKPRYILLASTDLELDGHKLVELCGACFQSEFLFRDSQQYPGLTACQERDAATLACHCNAALATLNLGRAEELLASTD